MKTINGGNRGTGAFACLIGIMACAGAGYAQDVDIRGDGSNSSIILQGKNINPNSSDMIGVEGYSAPIGFYGIGVKGMGGYRGVEGRCDQSLTTNSGVGDRTGLYGAAYNGGTNYGVKGYAIGATGTNYGVWGTASGTNSRAGYFSGDLEYTGALVHNSDVKLKKNIADIQNCLNLVGKLTPKEFDYRADEYPNLHLPRNRQKGLIAQNVEAVLPELVRESVYPDQDGEGKAQNAMAKPKKPDTYKTVDYLGLIPVLIGAIQEQEEEIRALRTRLDAR